MLQTCLPWLDCCWPAAFWIHINFLVWLKDQIVSFFFVLYFLRMMFGLASYKKRGAGLSVSDFKELFHVMLINL